MPLLSLRDLRVRFQTAGRHGARGRRRRASTSRAARRSASSANPGCGKSTLGKASCAWCRSTAGAILFDGADICGARPRRAAPRCAARCRWSSRTPTARSIRASTVGTHRRRAAGDRTAGSLRRAPSDACRLMRWSASPDGPAALSARILRRPAPAHRHRPRAGARPQARSSATSRSRRSTSRSRRRCINLLIDLQQQLGLAYLFITHDLSRGRAHLRPGDGDVSRPHRRDSGPRPRSGAARTIPTRRPCWRRHRLPIRGSPAPASARCCKANCRAP